ncbi:prolyl oligopeptidase family serine peptidase [Rudanella paleaurantiibacter]|uniref:Proline-specific endopeptidase n=1 Tax=Rudanella paleaurantiibacter TaxID=2614655 RepID=A0A7J5U1X2_9BACT|nr:S9 family peptidase [Rudanella paleaurantiibacter]KAB7731648.1 prolyl oligopeptidase family serine peptidase [Rudanella paleaurantiibacter]
MKTNYLSIFCLTTLFGMANAQTPTPLAAPKAAVKPKQLTIHGDTRVDNYYYLNERENPEVIDYLKAENAYLEQNLAPVKELRGRLFEEMKGRIKQQDQSVPYKEGDYYYQTNFVEGGEYPIYVRKKGALSAPEEVMFDCNQLAKGHAYYNLGGYEVSDNDELAIFCEDTVSRRLYTLRIKNLKTGQIYPEAIPNVEAGDFAWAADNKTLFYIKKDVQTLLGYQVYRHVLGTDPKQDVLVYEEKDNQFYMGLYRMKSKKYIAVVSDHNGVTTEYRLLEAAKPTESFTVFYPRERGHEYDIQHFGNKFYVRTNYKAQNYRLMEVPEGQQANRAAWKEVIPHRADVFLQNMDVFANHLVLGERKEGLTRLRVINQKNKSDHYLEFGEPAYVAGMSYNPEFDTNVLRYSYASLTTPGSTFDYNMDTKEKTLLKQQEVLGGFNKDNYVSERVYATARDGVKVPISLVYRKGTKKDGSAPLLQYAYGSYGSNTEPGFGSARLSLLDRGFIYAIAHIRGGQEMGRHWYEDGKMLKKKNTFNDFVDCSKFLIEQKYTNPTKLFALGGSAGGLLMGAVVNQAPELYRGVVAAVPFVDVVTTMLDETIPLTTGEWEEWGNPKTKKYYDYMKSYSPYDNVEKKAYPNMLVTTGLHDSQVQYWEPAKWVAKLRTMKTDQNQLLLHTNMEAGHGGASGRFEALKEVALEYAFMLNLLGIQQ